MESATKRVVDPLETVTATPAGPKNCPGAFPAWSKLPRYWVEVPALSRIYTQLAL
jgi:hypothetical protein